MRPRDVEALRPPLAPFAHPIGPDGRVQIDMPCRRCAYNLRSLPLHAHCPECNFAVTLSLRNATLAYSDAKYVRRLALGAHLLVIGASGIAGAVFLYTAFGALGDFVIRFALLGVALAGAWVVTMPDPSTLGEGDYGRFRRMARLLLPAALLIPSLGALYRTSAGAAIVPILVMLQTLACFMVFVGVLALMQYLRCLGIRMGNNTVERQFTFCLRGTMVCVPSIVIIFVFLAWFRILSSAWSTAVALLAGALGVGLIVTIIAVVAATWTVARALLSESHLASQITTANDVDQLLPDRFE